jgi:hypothetical protein
MLTSISNLEISITEDNKLFMALSEDIWNDMLTAEFNELYWQYMAQRYANYDTRLKIFIALMSSGTVASWYLWQMPPYDLVWKTLSAFSAITAILQPILNYPQTTKEIEQLTDKWIDIGFGYKKLWGDIEGKISNEKKIREHHTKLQEIQNDVKKRRNRIKIAHCKKLNKRCQEEVNKKRGLNGN